MKIFFPNNDQEFCERRGIRLRTGNQHLDHDGEMAARRLNRNKNETFILLFMMEQTVTLTVHVVLLAIPPQTHGDEAQQDEHHHHQNAAHDQVQQPPGGAGGLGRVGTRRGDGVLAGRPRRLTSCGRTEASLKTWSLC